MVAGPHHLEGRHARRQHRLRARQQGGYRFVVGQAAKGGRHGTRLGPQAQHGARDHAQGAFAADQEVAQVVAGIVLDHAVGAADDAAVGQHRFDVERLLAHHAVLDDAVAARIRGQVAADGATAARTEVERKQKARRVGRHLHRFQRRAGQHRHGARHRIDRFDAIHQLQAQRQFAAMQAGAARQPGQAALRHHRQAVGVADGHDARHLPGAARARQRHRLGARHAAPVGVLAAGKLLRQQDHVAAQRGAQGGHGGAGIGGGKWGNCGARHETSPVLLRPDGLLAPAMNVSLA